MKTTILFSAFFLCFSSTLTAQDVPTSDNTTNPYSFGVRIGANLYDITATSNRTGDTGFFGGLFIERKWSQNWALQFEANYAGLYTLQFPLILKYNLGERLVIYGGAQLDFSLEQQRMDNAFRNKRFGASLLLGAQYNINSKWFLEGRYIHGLSDQFPIFQGLGVESIFGKKRSFNFGIGYKF